MRIYIYGEIYSGNLLKLGISISRWLQGMKVMKYVLGERLEEGGKVIISGEI